jgi:hypothetical protein
MATVSVKFESAIFGRSTADLRLGIITCEMKPVVLKAHGFWRYPDVNRTPSNIFAGAVRRFEANYNPPVYVQDVKQLVNESVFVTEVMPLFWDHNA